VRVFDQVHRVVFFGHLTPAVEDLRHQHVYQPRPLEQRSPALAAVIHEIQMGRFGDGGIFEPYVLVVISVVKLIQRRS
jgi:starch phosphorylase